MLRRETITYVKMLGNVKAYAKYKLLFIIKISRNCFQGFKCLLDKNSLKSNVPFLPFSQHKHLKTLPNSKTGTFSLIWQKQFPSLGFQWNRNEFDCFCLRWSTKSSPNYAVSMPKHILYAAQLQKYHMRTTAGPQRRGRRAYCFYPLGKCKMFLTCSCWVEW